MARVAILDMKSLCQIVQSTPDQNIGTQHFLETAENTESAGLPLQTLHGGRKLAQMAILPEPHE